MAYSYESAKGDSFLVDYEIAKAEKYYGQAALDLVYRKAPSAFSYEVVKAKYDKNQTTIGDFPSPSYIETNYHRGLDINRTYFTNPCKEGVKGIGINKWNEIQEKGCKVVYPDLETESIPVPGGGTINVPASYLEESPVASPRSKKFQSLVVPSQKPPRWILPLAITVILGFIYLLKR